MEPAPSMRLLRSAFAVIVALALAAPAPSQSQAAKKGKAAAKPKVSRAQPKPAPPAAGSIAPADLAKRSFADLEQLIAEQRSVVKVNPRDERARRNLGWISVEVAGRILRAESLGRSEDAASFAALARSSLVDTVWRVTQLVREDPGPAQAALGLFNAQGILVPRDPARGCEFFGKAAAAEHVAARYRASLCAAKADPGRSRQLLEQAAQGGHAAAQEMLGRECIERAQPDPVCARKWLEPAVAQGRVSAMSVFAWLVAREGSDASLAKAAELYRVAAQAGDLAAQNNLGELYETGRGVPRDVAQALQWYRRSAEGGLASAQFNLARFLAFGMGAERDAAAARTWAEKAKDQGIAQASELLKLLAENDKAR